MPKYATFPQTASVQDLQRNYRKILDQVKASRNPVFVMRNNVPEAVLVNIDVWHESVKKTEQEELRLAEKAIKSYEADKKAGKLITLPKGGLAALIRNK